MFLWGPLVLRYALVMWTLYFSHFFKSHFLGLRRIRLRAKVLNLVFIICTLLAGIDCVTDKLKARFSSMKNTLFCLKFSPQDAENSILGLWRFKIFWRRTRTDNLLPPSPLDKGTNGLLLIQSVTPFKPTLATPIFIETPETRWQRLKNAGKTIAQWVGHSLLTEKQKLT